MTVVACSFVRIRAETAVERRVAELAGDLPIVIDHYASRRCGATIGDVRVRVGGAAPDEALVELEPIGSVRVLAERHLVRLLADGAAIRFGNRLLGSQPSIELDHPEAWLCFLEEHPQSRR
jgi:hypothetical protein